MGKTTINKKKDNPLFRPGPNDNLNACVGSNGGPYDFSSYGEGFFYSAFYSIEQAIKGEWNIDLLIYPVVFNFRHGIELYLKHFVVLGNRYLVESDNQYTPSHKLDDNLKIWFEIISKIPESLTSEKEQKFVDKTVNYFLQIDHDGQTFRYPEDMAKCIRLLDISVINIEVLFKNMKKLFDIFENWDSGLICLLEDRNLSSNSIDC